MFQGFDSRGDGLITQKELAEAFLRMGVNLDLPSLEAIFRYFDSNGSGAVHWGEFVWAFYNRRGFLRRWQRASKGLTLAQVRDRFHKADKNGDGQLTIKELQDVFKSFGMDYSQEDIQTLADKFDVDGDGDLDLEEFISFIYSQQRSLFERSSQSKSQSGKGNGKGILHPKGGPPRSRSRSSDRLSRSAATSSQLKASSSHVRSRSAGRDSGSGRDQVRVSLRGEQWDESDIDRAVRQSLLVPNRTGADSAPVLVGDDSQPLKGLGSSLDAVWMTRMLKAQADMEQRLGKKYYSTS